MSDEPPFPGLVDFQTLWDFADAEKTEANFRELMSQPGALDHPSYRDELLTQIARAEGLQRKFDDAHRTLDQVENHLDGQPATVRVRYLLERGRVLNSSGSTDDARPLFLDAWELARESSLDGLAVDAAHMLAIVERGDKARHWNEVALDHAERSSSPAARNWLGSLYNNLGWTYHDQGDFEKALELFQRALAWREQQDDPVATRTARWSVARAMRSLGQVEAALVHQQGLLAELQDAGETDGFVFEELAECHLILHNERQARPFFQLAYDELSKDNWLVENEPSRLLRIGELSEPGED